MWVALSAVTLLESADVSFNIQSPEFPNLSSVSSLCCGANEFQLTAVARGRVVSARNDKISSVLNYLHV